MVSANIEFPNIEIMLHQPIVDFYTEPKTPTTTNRIIVNNNANNNHTNNTCTKTINGNVPLIAFTAPTPPTQQKHRQQKHSNAMPTAMQSSTDDGSVMKKIISISVEQFNNIENSMGKAAPMPVTTTRPDFVPEKLHFSAYEQFEGEFVPFNF